MINLIEMKKFIQCTFLLLENNHEKLEYTTGVEKRKTKSILQK